MHSHFWKSLESLPGLSALPHVWLKYLGPYFRAFQILCLEPSADLPTHVPCPRHCGCDHFIIHRQDRTAAVGVCCCTPARCPDIPLTIQQITPLAVNRLRLARAITQALNCDFRLTRLAQLNTFQIGSWSAGAVPVALTLQSDRLLFRASIAELAATTHRPFILLAPTSLHLDLVSLQILDDSRAACFDLQSIFSLTPHGTLLPTTPPGRLFARFNPDPNLSASDDTARQTIALIKALDSAQPFRKAPLLTVFRLYCSEGLSASEVAKKCRCARSVVFSRLHLLRQKLGRPPAQLRQLSSHFDKIEQSLSDPRAARIHRPSALDT